MKEALIIKKVIEISAGKAKVWEALTNSAWTKKYMFGYDVESDWKTGSPILWQLNQGGQTYKRKGKVLLAERGKFLKFTDFNPNVDNENQESNHAIITYELTEYNGSTVLQVTDDCAGNDKKYGESSQFWNSVLPKLKEILEE